MKKPNEPGEVLRPITVKPSTSVSQLLSKMADTGFQGRTLAEACAIYEQMINDPGLTILLGYSGSLSVAGQWTIICWLLENHYIDIMVTTGANISEDIVPAMGHNYYKGMPIADDDRLFRNGVNRYYDVYGIEEDYLEMTELLAEFICNLDSTRSYSSKDFLYKVGLWLKSKGIRSILSVAAENKIPVFCPAIADSPFGDAALIARSKGFNLQIDAMKDYAEFMFLGEYTKETGVVYIGGGVPKDFIQLFAVTGNLLYEERKIPNRPEGLKRRGTDESYYPHKYAVQIMTDSPQWGGLSGCSFEEAISWGKETSDRKFTQCFCDATIALPIISHALAERITSKRQGLDLSSLFDEDDH